jgi:hypothetical protein
MRNMRIPLGLVAAAMAALTASTETAIANESRYTRHVWQRCPAIGSPEPGIVSRRRCPGAGGLAVTWTADSDSSSVSFGPRPVEEDLAIGSFFEAGDTIEWRAERGGSRPFAAVIRYRTGASVGRLDSSRLVIYRIEPGGRSCIMATLDGRASDANARARELADSRGPSFRCGSPRLTR